jgi:SPP1 family predicted phage head-tail adaptor
MIKTKVDAMKQVGKTYHDKIYIQENRLLSDGEGGFKDGWVDIKSLWGNVYTIQAKQQYEFNSIGIEATHRIEVQENITVDEKNRIRFGGAVNDPESGRKFEIVTFEDKTNVITCKEMR